MTGRIVAVESRDLIIISSSITRPNNTTAYAAGDALAAVTTDAHLTFADALKDGMKTGEIVAAKVLSSAYVATGPAIDLMLFSSDVGTDADNAAATITDAEMASLIGVVSFATGSWKPGDMTAGAGGNQAQIVTGVNMPIKLPLAASVAAIYGCPILRNAYVPVANEIFTFTLYIRPNP